MKAGQSLLNHGRFFLVLSAVMLLVAGPGTAHATSFGLFGTSPLKLHAETEASPYDTVVVEVGIQLTSASDSVRKFAIEAEWNTDVNCDEGNAELVYESFTLVDEGDWTSLGAMQAGNTLIIEGEGPGISVPDDYIVGTITFTVPDPMTDKLDACLKMPEGGEWQNMDSLVVYPKFGDLRVDLREPTATEAKTWGQLKGLFK